MNILITGGAGYIGSHVALHAIDQGCKVTILDDLSTGSKKNIPKKAKFHLGSTLSMLDLKNILTKNSFDGIIHLAASKAVGESMKNPTKYASNNIVGGINLINQAIHSGIKYFIFSSTAAIYGSPDYNPIDEKHKLNPENYYGFSKLFFEENLRWLSSLTNIKICSLRYFNAAGYDSKNRISVIEKNPQNLIPKVMEVAFGLREKVFIYGSDYDTIDGTGVRDYIHVSDLASAHIKAINYLKRSRNSIALNLGTGIGFSVLEVLQKVSEVCKKDINHEFINRRLGDPDTVIAKAEKAKTILNWKPIYSDLKTIVESSNNAYTRFLKKNNGL